MKKVLVVLFLLLLAVSCFADKKAIIISDTWMSKDGTFTHEYDAALAYCGYTYDNYKSNDVDKWIDKLQDYDIMCLTSLYNYEKPVDFSKYSNQLRAFVEKGGLIIHCDASYDTGLNLFNTVNPDFNLTTSLCNHKLKQDQVKEDYKDSTLLTTPNNLKPLLIEKGTCWGHTKTWNNMESLIACNDGGSLFLVGNLGKGLLVITNKGPFQGTGGTNILKRILENALNYRKQFINDISFSRIELNPKETGDHTCSFDIINKSSDTKTCKIEFSGEGFNNNIDITLEPNAKKLVTSNYNVPTSGEKTYNVKLYNDGDLLDETIIKRTINPLLSLYSKNRFLYPKNKDFTYDITLCPKTNTTNKLEIKTYIDNEFINKENVKDNNITKTISVLPISLGKHTIKVELLENNQVIDTKEIVFNKYSIPKVYVREDGTLLVDKKPFLPFGWYHVSWAFSDEDRIEFIKDIAQYGFNTCHVGITKLDQWETFLPVAQKAGVKVITEFGIDQAEVVKKYKDYPAVLGWNCGDEPDGQGVSPEEMHSRYERLKEIDPNHIIYMVLCDPTKYKKYAYCSDIISPDPYPLSWDTTTTTTSAYINYLDAKKEAQKEGKYIWAVPQAQGYKGSVWRYPTFKETRNMTYLAFLAGAKGIIYYVYKDFSIGDDNGYRVKDHPEYWDGMKTMPKEVKQIENYILDGKITEIETGYKDVFAGYFTMKNSNKKLFIIANTAQSVRNINIKSNFTSLTNAFENREANLKLNNKSIAGDMSPLEVYTYYAK